ncbi:hypothetical protein GOV09_02695 [Candidatus Woesearchaeota archaeon]|nr:hypothetical protein [Candidatus Woesearchaeota archaeon]
MLEIITVIGAGVILGLQHSLEPDHITALVTLSKRDTSFMEFVQNGIRWGLGHSMTLLFVGVFLLAFKIRLSAITITFFEMVVGVMLVALGLRSIFLIKRKRIHIHRHGHEGLVHTHFHSHVTGSHHEHNHYPFYIGLVHGLAGSGPLIILILATVSKLTYGILFILLFGASSIIGMAFVSGLISIPLAKLRKYNLEYTAGSICVLIGIKIVIDGLLVA